MVKAGEVNAKLDRFIQPQTEDTSQLEKSLTTMAENMMKLETNVKGSND